MKIIPFKIPKQSHESLRVQVDEKFVLYNLLHQHPEIQITAVVEGKGTLLCGDL